MVSSWSRCIQLCLSSPEDDIFYLQCLLPNQWSYERLCATTAMVRLLKLALAFGFPY
ncbi:hypothetical protein M404DRAFT_996654 [Pisolithus tinctorius Marx 270]|uniref:Uncharacterized protein n=1 Tax=Pisolithus tinctorius Marx 270 TaxID=870435 RepID=A0A0C3PLY3_PISTI|nr:hypothetical protein M404DRAFT_996654 [Pisolithus tinctorius Marx 270]